MCGVGRWRQDRERGTRRSEREKHVLTVAQWSFPASALRRKLGGEVVSKSLWGKASINPHTTSTINGVFIGLRIKPHIQEHPWRLHGALRCNNTVWSHTYVPALHRLKATECLLLLSLSLSFSLSLSLTHSLSVRDHGRYAYSGYIWGWGDLEAVFPSQSLVLLHKDEEQSGVTCKCTYCVCKGHTHTHTIQTKTGVQIIM